MPLWYHCIDVAPGVSTPGWFDLRPVVGELPWPDLHGLRCLDVGTYDGFLAFEMERRGASEVVATDLAAYEDWDWEHDQRRRGTEWLRNHAGPEKGLGFEVARGLLGSSATLHQVNVYDLDPEVIGQFDLVCCGSLLLHLRDPLRALAAIRSVCRGLLLCTDQVDLRLSLLTRRRALVRLDGTGGQTQWWIPNPAGHRQMVRAAGFDVLRDTGPYAVPFGPGHPARTGARSRATGVMRRLVAGGDGVPHHAVLASVR